MSDEVLLPGLVAIEHLFEIPLDDHDPGGERIACSPGARRSHGRERPLLVYLQGGPGSRRPGRRASRALPAGLTGR